MGGFRRLLDRILDRWIHLGDALILKLLLLLGLRRTLEVRKVAALEVNDDLLCDIVDVGLAALEQLSGFFAELLRKVISILPIWHAIGVINVLMIDLVKDGSNVLRRVRDLLGADDGLQNLLRVTLVLVVYDTRAVDEVDALGQCDVLPDLRLTRDRCYTAAGFLHKRVDDGRLAYVWVADQADTNVLLVAVEDVELLEELDETAFAERVLHTGVEGEGRCRLLEDLDPLLRHRGRNQVTFVEDENKVFVRALILQVVLDELGASAVWVAGVEHVEENVRAVNDLVELFPDTLAGAFEEDRGLYLRLDLVHMLGKVNIGGRIVLLSLIGRLRNHLVEVGRADGRLALPPRRAEGVGEGLNLQESLTLGDGLVEGLFDQI